MNKIVRQHKKIEKAVVSGYKIIEDTVVNGYKAIEDTVVGGYKRIEDGFVKAFLSDDDADDGADTVSPEASKPDTAETAEAESNDQQAPSRPTLIKRSCET